MEMNASLIFALLLALFFLDQLLREIYGPSVTKRVTLFTTSSLTLSVLYL